MGTKQLATRVDEEQEQEFRENTRRLGTTPADAMRMFISAFNVCKGFPYDVRINALTEVADVEAFATEQEATEFATRLFRKNAHAAW
ncbi:MAG: type II toxin-antitoxin system RelB/DinJ family antitoxin [Coriobacteriales bacterium]|nr:type II toxin-antitoxin system RelB/DinJ family antitoxin [Coriobacteriales bacterium]